MKKKITVSQRALQEIERTWRDVWRPFGELITHSQDSPRVLDAISRLLDLVQGLDAPPPYIQDKLKSELCRLVNDLVEQKKLLCGDTWGKLPYRRKKR